MPSILEELAQDQRYNATCRACRWVASRPAEERRQWETALAEKDKYTHSSVSRLMCKIDETANITQEIVMNHREKKHRIPGG